MAVNRIAIFLASRAARAVLRGVLEGESLDPSSPAITGLVVSNLVVREDASNGLVAYLYAVGGGVGVTFTLTDNAGGVFAILNGNELHKVDSFTTSVDDTITIRAVDDSGDAYEETFVVDVIPSEQPAGDSGVGDGDVVTPDPTDPGNDGYQSEPVEVTSDIGSAVSAKTGGSTVFLKNWGTPVAGRSYVMKYQADWSGMSAQGRYAAVGFGLKAANNFHMTALRGNGAASTVMLASRIYGQFSKPKNYTITNDGAATNGTRTGPNWLKMVVSGDGTQQSLYTSGDDGATWDLEIETADPTPLADVTDATQFGPAAYFSDQDTGAFVITVTEFWQLPANTVLPVISGTITEDETLTTTTGTWTGDGITYSYQWLRDGSPIGGATSSTYVLAAADVGADISVTVTATNAGGGVSATSATVGPIEAGGDPYFSSVVLLASFDGSNGQTSFTDESNAGRTLTFVGNAQLTNDNSKFGTTSLRCTTNSGGRVTIPDSADWTMTGEFTIEFWLYPGYSGSASSTIFSHYNGAAGQHYIATYWHTVGNEGLEFAFSNTGSSVAPNLDGTVGSLSATAWHHIAISRDSSNLLRMFINGTQVASLTRSGSYDAAQNFVIFGRTSAEARSEVRLSEMRVTKGVCRYAAEFTPPSEAFPRQ